MPIQLIDNFDLGTTKPLDNRIVVGSSQFYQTKDQIQYRYAGLRVWDLNLSLPFVWTGTTWSNENSGTVIVTGGAGGYIPKFTGGVPSNVQTVSQIYESISGLNTFYGIGTTAPTSKLQVVGTITGTLFSGDGAQLTNLNATNVATGTLSLNRLQNGTLNSILVADATPTWKSGTTVRVGSSNGLVITNESSSVSDFDLLFSRVADVYPDTLLPASYNVRSAQTGTRRIQFRPQTGQLLIGDGTAALPAFSFSGSSNTGIYRPSAFTIGISCNSTQVLLVNNVALTVGQSAVGSAYIRTNSTGFATPTYTFWGADQFGMFRSTQGLGFAGGDATATSRHILDLGAGQSTGANSLRIYSPNLTTSFLEIQRWQSGNANGWTRFVSSTAAVVDFLASIGGTDSPLTSFNVTANTSAFVGRVGIGTYNPVYKLHCIADSSNGSVLFATNIWTSAGHNSTIYIGDQNHYIRATFGGLNGLSLATVDNIKLLTGSPQTERLQIRSDGVIYTSNVPYVNLGNITGAQQSFLNVERGLGIEGNWFSINSVFINGSGFQSAKSLATGIFEPGPNGLFIKIQDNTGSGAYHATVWTTFGMTPGNVVPQFQLRTNTSLYNNRFNPTEAAFRPVYIDANSILRSGTRQGMFFATSTIVTISDDFSVYVVGTSYVNASIIFPPVASSAGKIYTVINKSGGQLNPSIQFERLMDNLGSPLYGSIPGFIKSATFMCDGLKWYVISYTSTNANPSIGL
jgi:hypothetical protein